MLRCTISKLSSSKLYSVAIALGVLNVNAFAHPGHTVEVAPADSPMHYIVQPEHALTLVIFAAALWFVAKAVLHRSTARPV